jgi:GT2 family glycosyltransferase
MSKFLKLVKIYGFRETNARTRFYVNQQFKLVENETPKTELKLSSLMIPNKDWLGKDELQELRKIRYKHSCDALCNSNKDIIVSLVIATIGRSSLFVQAVTSAVASLETSNLKYEVLISIDANSNPEELKRIHEDIEKLKMNCLQIFSTKLSGFGDQINFLARSAKGEELLILNDDAILEKKTVTKLYSARRTNLHGILSPVILDLDGIIQEAGGFINTLGETEWILRGYPKRYLENLKYFPVAIISAVCWLISKNEFQELGGFTGFGKFPYFEDTKFIFDGERKIECHLISDALVYHKISESSSSEYKKLIVDKIVKPQFKEWWLAKKKNNKKLTIVAFYLPQFYETPYNNEWWGTGYTEWTAIANSKEILKDKQSKITPSELGFYDLSDPTILLKQSKLASEYGINVFAVMTYWFNGKQLLEKPLQNFLTQNYDTKFVLYWANEPWTRRWDGLQDEVLMNQHHTIEDSIQFIEAHREYFLHKNYGKIKNKPVLFIYRRDLFSNTREHLEAMRQTAAKIGIGEMFICVLESFNESMERNDPTILGFDAAVEYPPHGSFPNVAINENLNFLGRVHNFEDVITHYAARPFPNYPVIKGVTTGFDNTPRLGSKSTIFVNSNLENFYKWLRSSAKISLIFGDKTDNWLAINAWNEWSESASLEPSLQFGRNYLETVRFVKENLEGTWE